MFDTVSISELQKATAKNIKNTKTYKYILANNKKIGMIFSEKAIEYMEKSGVLDELEDYLLATSPKFDKARQEARKIIKTGDYSECVTFDQLCQSA